VGSVRQVLLWFRRERVPLLMRAFDSPGGQTVWNLPVYNSVLKLLTNPMYAGAYAFGKTHARTTMVEGRARKPQGTKSHERNGRCCFTTTTLGTFPGSSTNATKR
jgi:hypothetical protein